MAQLTHPVEPFGEVNVYRNGNALAVKATILMVPNPENGRTGLAIDASASMIANFGTKDTIFKKGEPNHVEPVARTMASFLANYSFDGRANVVYWACSPDGSAIEEVGRFNADEVQTVSFTGPKKNPWGRQTRLLPPVKYFAETAFKNAPWAMGVIVTDGIIDDLPDVKSYCTALGKQIATGQRGFFKLVLIGLGPEVDEGQMEELDDMFEGSGLQTSDGEDVDIWDHKLASEMQKLEEIFSEVVGKHTIVVPSGRVLDSNGKVAQEYSDGVPAVLEFNVPSNATGFTLEWPGGNVSQDFSEILSRI